MVEMQGYWQFMFGMILANELQKFGEYERNLMDRIREENSSYLEM
jgi:hypothetical protein